MKIAYWGPLAPRASEAVEYGERLLPHLAREADVGVFLDGYDPRSRWITGRCRVHDMRREHYRNVLFEYDAAVYQLADGAEHDYLREPLAVWPGVVVVHGGGVDPILARNPPLPPAALDRSLGVLVHSRELERRLRADHPWTATAFLDLAGDDFARVARRIVELVRDAQLAPAAWLEALLETSCAEIPGFFPAERSAPWRAEIDDLLGR